MNPFRRLRLIRGTQHFSQEEGGAYGQGLKTIRRQISAHRLLPSLRRSHGSGAGARTGLVRLALRQLRRTDRSGDSRPSTTEWRAFRRRERRRRSGTTLSQLIRLPAEKMGHCRSLFRRIRHSHQLQDNTRVRIQRPPAGQRCALLMMHNHLQERGS
jgi:hypothetical protein